MPFKFKRGTNISHWLSQSDARGDERRKYFTADDVKRLADWGFDHIRLPVDEVQMWDASGKQDNEAFDLMDSAIDWALDVGMKAVVDLHILRSHFFNQKKEPALFTDPTEAARFADFWRQLSKRLCGRPGDKVAYELMNEPVASDSNDWNRVAMMALKAVREMESERTIILGSNRWNSVKTFDQLEVPDDRNLILSFHFYYPMLVTHHRAWWCPEGKMYAGPVQYPGQPIPREKIRDVITPEGGRLVSLNLDEVNRHYDRDAMLADMKKPLDVAARTGLPLYCGEFGVIDLTPQPVRLAWYRDIISISNEKGIAWANWDYKEEFGILDKQGRSTGIAEVMLSV